jgi:hypothetical protein
MTIPPMRVAAIVLLGILWQSAPGASVDVSSHSSTLPIACAQHRSFCLSLMPHRRSPSAPLGGDLAVESALDEEEELSDLDPVEACALPSAYPHITSPRRVHPSIHSQVPMSEYSRRLPVLRC